MINPTPSKGSYKVVTLVALVALTAAGCLPVAFARPTRPVVQTTEVSREVTGKVTQEATLIVPVSVPATITPTLAPTITLTPSLTSTITPTPTISLTPSLTSTFTRTPTITPTPPQSRVTILDHIGCWWGPGDAYGTRYGLPATVWMNVKGRNPEGTWILVEDGGHANPCWVRTEFTHFTDGGDLTTHNLQILDQDAALPYAFNLYKSPDGVQTFRTGTKVEVYWNAVWMTEDDYEGYLIESWLCLNGQLVFKPISSKPDLSQNSGTLGIIIHDEPGCQVASSARIYTH